MPGRRHRRSPPCRRPGTRPRPAMAAEDKSTTRPALSAHKELSNCPAKEEKSRGDFLWVLINYYSLRSKLYDISRILESQNNLKFDQDYEKNIKIYDIKLMYYENITRILSLYNNVIILLYKFGQI